MSLTEDECRMLSQRFSREAEEASRKASETRKLLKHAIDDARSVYVSTAREEELIETYEQLAKSCRDMATHFAYLSSND